MHTSEIAWVCSSQRRNFDGSREHDAGDRVGGGGGRCELGPKRDRDDKKGKIDKRKQFVMNALERKNVHG
jgi:hypothetical protein